MPGHQDQAALGSGVDHLLRIFNAHGHRLFNKNVLAVFQRRQHWLKMLSFGSYDANRVNIGHGDKIVEVARNVSDSVALRCTAGTIRRNIGHGGYPCVRYGCKCRQMALAECAATDQSNT